MSCSLAMDAVPMFVPSGRVKSSSISLLLVPSKPELNNSNEVRMQLFVSKQLCSFSGFPNIVLIIYLNNQWMITQCNMNKKKRYMYIRNKIITLESHISVCWEYDSNFQHFRRDCCFYRNTR